MYVQQAQGLGIAYFAKKMLQDKGLSLEGKRCIITGSNATSLALAEKLTELGAVPLTFSDTSGNNICDDEDKTRLIQYYSFLFLAPN